MDPLVIGIVLIVIAVAAVLVWRTSQQRRTDQLRHQYGVEYDHTEQHLWPGTAARCGLAVQA